MSIQRGILSLVVLFLMSACALPPPAPRDTEAWKFEPVADKAVIYVVRGVMDARIAAALSIGNAGMISTHAGTYFRWEVTPGMQRIETFGASLSAVNLDAKAGQIYFVEHVVSGGMRVGVATALVRHVDDTRGRWLVRQAQHI